MWKVIVHVLIYSIVASEEVCSVLISAPKLSAVKQCGCNNELYVLTPDQNLRSNVTPISIDLTAFFNFNTNTNSSNCLQDSNGAPSTSHLIPAALIALDEINNSSNILQGYHLQLDVRDSKCDPDRAVYEFADSIADRLRQVSPPNSPYNLGVLGPGCEAATEAVSAVNDISLKLPIISYGPPPVVKDRLPTLFDTSRSALLSMRSAIGVLRHFNWTNNIAFISEDSDAFILTVENVIISNTNGSVSLKDSSGEIPVKEFTKINVRTSKGNIFSVEQFLDSVRQRSIRVIVALLSQKNAAELVCMAKSSGALPGDGYVYVFVGSFASNWWKIETEFCILLDEDVQSALVISGDIIQPDVNTMLSSDRTVHDFKVEYAKRLQNWCNDEIFLRRVTDTAAGSIYDAVWAFALALNRSTNLIDEMVKNNMHYDPKVLNSTVTHLESVDFQGVTGPFHFEDGLRERPDTIQQIQDSFLTVVAHYQDEVVLDPGTRFQWNGTNNSTVPSDKPTVIVETTAIYWLVIVSVFTMAGFIFGILMCIFNGYYSHHKILLASSQRLNYIIIVGVFFGYSTVFILTILTSPLSTIMSDGVYKALCLIRIWLLPLSFTFTYGIMFSRAWRIYRVFNNPWSKSRLYKDYYLLLIVLVAVTIDVLILLPWTIIDPYRRSIRMDPVNYNHYTQCVFSTCSSSSFAWLAVLSAYKIIFIMIGILVMSLVREGVVRRKIFDDSRSLAAAVYVTSLAFLVGLPLTFLFLFARRPLLSYLVSALWVNISSSGTLIFIFLPKFYKIVVKKDSGKNYKTARSLYLKSDYSSVYMKSDNSKSTSRPRKSMTTFNDVSQTDLDTIRGTSNSSSDSNSELEGNVPLQYPSQSNLIDEECSAL